MRGETTDDEPALRKWLPETPRAVFSIAIVLIANSFLRGVQTPALGAANNFLSNYQFGFCKRCFFGALLSLLGLPYFYTYSFFFWFSLALLTLNLLLLVALLKHLLYVAASSTAVPVLVYASSFAVVHWASMIGYFDHLALLVALLAMRADGFRIRAAIVGALFSVSVLTHETGYLLFFPAICFRFLPDLVGEASGRSRAVFCVLVAGISALAVLMGVLHLPLGAVEEMYAVLRAKADYPVGWSGGAAAINAYENFLRMMEFWRSGISLVRFLSATIVTFPVIAFLIGASLRALAERGQGPIVRVAAILTSLSPLALYVLGEDIERWNTHAITASFLVFATAVLYFPTAAPSSRREASEGPTALRVAVVLIAMNLGSTITVWSQNPIESFPYPRHMRDLIDMATGRAPFPPRSY